MTRYAKMKYKTLESVWTKMSEVKLVLDHMRIKEKSMFLSGSFGFSHKIRNKKIKEEKRKD